MNRSPQANKAYLLIAMSLHFVPNDKLLLNTSLTQKMLENRESIDMTDAIQIVHNIYQYSEIEYWPALLGEHLGASTHGPVGYASLSAETLGQAISTFVQWYVVRCQCYDVNIVEFAKHVEIIIKDTTSDEQYEKFFFEALMRALEILMHTIIGEVADFQAEIHFKSHYDDCQLLQRLYKSQLAFQQKENKMILPKAYWYRLSPLFDQQSYAFNLSKCRQLLEEIDHHNRLETSVKNLINDHFVAQMDKQNLYLDPPSLTQVCARLYQSERTLIRKLKQDGTSYKLILEQQRRRLALQLLNEGQRHIHEIAEILGYHDPANFTRAFKKWCGISPSVYKKNQSIH